MVCKKLLTRVTCVALTGVVCLPVMAVDSSAMMKKILEAAATAPVSTLPAPKSNIPKNTVKVVKAVDNFEKKEPAKAAIVEGALISGAFRTGGAALASIPVTAPVAANPVVQGVITTTGVLISGVNALRIQEKASNK